MYTIYGIWIDVMRMGQNAGEESKSDAEWWVEHQSEIEFALKIFSGLGLAFWRRTPNEYGELDVRCSQLVKQLHRDCKTHSRILRARDKQLRANVARCTRRLNKSASV